ncbi:MAG: protein kinase domain-containing protein, partial [Planctomycetota bacterium]
MADSGADPYLGKTLGDFRIEAKLGEGAMGAVYRATQLSLERDIALKILPALLVKKHPEFVKRFVREAKVAAQISHPNIVQVHAVGNYKGIQYIAQEFVRGNSVADIIFKHGPLPERKALSIVAQAASGLGAGAVKEIVHRDVKPENLLLTQDGIVKVADFGLAKNTSTESMVTQAGQIMGTPAFMSPEQARSLPLDARSDIYSLGATLFQMITGEVPFRGENPLSTLFKHIDEPLPDPRELRKGLSEFTAGLIEKMMEKEPDDRFESYGDLEAILAEIPSEVPEDDEEEIPDLAGLYRPVTKISALTPTTATLTGGGAAKSPVLLWVLIGLLVGGAVFAVVLWQLGLFERFLDKGETGGGADGDDRVKWEILEPSDGAVLRALQVTVRGKVESGAVKAVRVNGVKAALRGGKFEAKLGLVGEGSRSIEVVVDTDKGEVVKRIGVTVDQTQPEVILEDISEGSTVHTNSEEYVLKGAVRDENLQDVTVNGVDSPLSGERGSEFRTSLRLEEGEGTAVEIVARDKAGNRCGFGFTLVLDKSPPGATLVAPEGGKAYGDAMQEIRVRFTEPVVKVKIAGIDARSEGDRIFAATRALSQGPNGVKVEAEDLAGNPLRRKLVIEYQRFHPQRLQAEEKAWKELKEVVSGSESLKAKLVHVLEFLDEFRDGKYAGETEVLLDSMKEELKTEGDGFTRVKEAADGAASPWAKIALWKGYLEKNPNSSWIGDVQSALLKARTDGLPGKAEGVERAERERTFVNRVDGALMVFVEAGEYPLGTTGGAPEDGPEVSCRLTGFYIYVHEVTNARYAAFLEAAGRDRSQKGEPFVLDSKEHRSGRFPWGLTKEGGRWKPVDGCDDHPVIFVTW